MKLFEAPTSPYCRKVRIVCFETNLTDRIEFVFQMPRDPSTGFYKIAPLGRIPALLTNDGLILTDSTVITEYLDAFASTNLFPRSGESKWRALVPLRHELLKDAVLISTDMVERSRATVNRVLDHLEITLATRDCTITIGDIAIGTALSYLDFRFPNWLWRDGRTTLSTWFDLLAKRPSFKSTAFEQPTS
jgi:glutathione S-transferase